MSVRSCTSKSRFILPLALLAAVAVGATWQRNGAIGDEPHKTVNKAAVRHAQELSEAFNSAAEVAMPSVVTIRSKTKAHPVAKSRSGKGENPFKGTPFEDFFNGRNPEDFGGMQSPRREGMGSGVIIDHSGIVLTNNHVVEGADEVIVHLADGREFKGEDIKTDEHTDLAVIRIHGAGTLPAATLGDSDKLKIGDWVMAIGNPFELEQTVSAGIISGLGRELSSARRAKFLQTDAAINPGNSGGPLINLEGEVIGINTAIATNNGAYQGVGFAIPVNLAKWVTGQLIKQGTVQRAYLGVQLNELNPDLADRLGGHRGEGVLVAEVFPNTPAAEAGFQPGDIIVKFDGQKVKDRSELQMMVERVSVNSRKEVEVLRNGKSHVLHVTAKAMPKDFAGLGRKGATADEDEKPSETAAYDDTDLGIEVTDVTPDKAEALGLQGHDGVLITKVDPDKAAAEAGLKEGMLIMKVGQKLKPIKSVDEFKAAMKGESLKDGVVLLVRIRNGNQFVVVKQ
jgi:serine protease Do